MMVTSQGTEAAQKLMILARELGVSMDISDVEVTPLPLLPYISPSFPPSL